MQSHASLSPLTLAACVPFPQPSVHITGGSGMQMYYVKIVPTNYYYLDRERPVQTNQYSVTEHFRGLGLNQAGHAGGAQQNGLPGVFVFYELSPIMVEFRESRNQFAHFITQLCAILGGGFEAVMFAPGRLFPLGAVEKMTVLLCAIVVDTFHVIGFSDRLFVTALVCYVRFVCVLVGIFSLLMTSLFGDMLRFGIQSQKLL